MRNIEPISPGTRIVAKLIEEAAALVLATEKPLPILGIT